MSPTTIPGNLILQSPTANDPLLDLNTQPSLDLQFATSKTLNDRVSGQNLITFSRSTTGTYVDSNGIIQTAAIDAPRFDHDPVTNASLGLLVEESRENLLQRSEEFNDTYWFKRNSAAIVPNAVVSPDGNTTADELQHPGGSTYARIETTGATPSVTLNASYSFTIYAKYKPSSDANYLAIQFQRASGVSYINLSTKTVDSGDGDVELLGSGWIRFRRTLVATSTGTNQVYIYPTNTTNTSPISIAADAGLYIWGAQLEAGAFPTSYIPTSGSSVPRAADVVSITGSNFSGWYNQSEGSFYVQEDSINNSQDKYYIFVSDGANSDRLWLSKDSVNRHIFRVYDSANTLQVVSASPILPSSPGLVSSQFVGAYFSGDSNSALNGSIVGASTNNTFVRSGSNSAYLGSTASGSYLNGHISRLTYYPYRLPDATLQEITS